MMMMMLINDVAHNDDDNVKNWINVHMLANESGRCRENANVNENDDTNEVAAEEPCKEEHSEPEHPVKEIR